MHLIILYDFGLVSPVVGKEWKMKYLPISPYELREHHQVPHLQIQVTQTLVVPQLNVEAILGIEVQEGDATAMEEIQRYTIQVRFVANNECFYW